MLADLEVMRATYETNNLGMAATFHPFVAPMRERGSGTLVGIASVAGIRGLPGHGAYCVEQGGGDQPTARACAASCAPFGVKVVTIAPGYIDTPLTQRQPLRDAVPDERRRRSPIAPSRAIERRRAATASFRGRWASSRSLLRMLPNALYDRLLAGRPRKQRQAGD